MKRFTIILGIISLTAFIACNSSDMENKDNPFFQEWDTPYGIPPFGEIKTEHYIPAFEEAMKRQNEAVKEIVENKDAANFENTIVALEFSGMMLTDVALVFYNMLSSNTSEELQELAQDISPMLSKHSDEILMNEDLFARIKEVYDNAESFSIDKEDQMLLDLTYKRFVRGGALLNDNDKDRLKDINEKLSRLTLRFGDNLLAETNNYTLVIENEDELAGLPDGVIEAAAATAKDYDMEGKWVFTLQNPSVMPFLTYADNRDLRKEIKHAYVNRCNNDNEYDNKQIILDIIKLRIERAQILGYNTHADYVLEINMAKNSENVYNLLDEIWAAALPVMKNEVEMYTKMLTGETGEKDFDAADWRYYAERLRKQKYDLDEEELKPYLQLDNVKEGIFKVSEKLFGLTFEQIEGMPLYHEDAEVFEVLDENGKHKAILFMDYHPRQSKRGGAWMSSFRDQYVYNDKNVSPIITVNCNFTPATSSQPALLTWDETTTFFHEFGHALHGILSDCKYPSTSGTSVPRDFVELPSQIMEHWVAEPEVLRMFAFHYETGEVIPEELIEKMKKAAHFNQGFATGEFLATAYLDMFYHTKTEFNETNPDAVIDMELNLLSDLGLIPEIYARHRSTYFAHGFSGGYSAGYYSYIWSEVLDSDAFAAFEENGLFDEATAYKLKTDIFSNGHKDDPMTMFVNFRGREPKIDFLLEKRGLK